MASNSPRMQAGLIIDIDVIAIFRIAPHPSSHRILGGVTGGLESWPGEKGVLASSSGTGPRMWPDARATCM